LPCRRACALTEDAPPGDGQTLRNAAVLDELTETSSVEHLTNSSVIGRLLEEISWEGADVRAYRDGGRGRENVLTAEVLWPLSCLPRDAFLGEVIRQAHGADHVRAIAAHEIEAGHITLLPDQIELGPTKVVVQPDATIVSPGKWILVEAKRLRTSSFQPEQLAREYVALIRESPDKTPLLLLLLGSPPPVTVKGAGRLSIEEAISSKLQSVLDRTPEVTASFDELLTRLPEVVAWTTWGNVRDVVSRQLPRYADASDGLTGTVMRLVDSVVTAIDWHA
jgi:hypothetical protein